MDLLLGLRKSKEPRGPRPHVLVVGDGSTALSYAARLAVSGALVALWRPASGRAARQITLRYRRLLSSDTVPVLVLGDEADLTPEDWDMVLLAAGERNEAFVTSHGWVGDSVPAVALVGPQGVRSSAISERPALLLGQAGLQGLVDGADIIDPGPFVLPANTERVRVGTNRLAVGLAQRVLRSTGIDVVETGDLQATMRAQSALLSLWIAGAVGAGGLSELLDDPSRWAVLCAAQREVLAVLRDQGVALGRAQRGLVADQMTNARRKALTITAWRPLYRQGMRAMLSRAEATYRPIYTELSHRLAHTEGRRPYLVRLVD